MEPIEQVPVERNEILLKLFFGRHQSNENTLVHLQAYQQKLERRYQTYNSIEQMISTYKSNEADARYWLFTLDYGKRTTLAAIEWCESTIEKLLMEVE